MGILPMSMYCIRNYVKSLIGFLQPNYLYINVNKTKCMVFHSDKKKTLYPKLFIDVIEIERVDYFNFLDLQLNHTLKWNNQLSCVSLKISKITGLLHKLKSEYPTPILKLIDNTLILPNNSYCILSWGSQIDKLFLLQKKAIRNISKSNFRAHIPNHCLKNTIYLKYTTYTIWQF